MIQMHESDVKLLQNNNGFETVRDFNTNVVAPFNLDDGNHVPIVSQKASPNGMSKNNRNQVQNIPASS